MTRCPESWELRQKGEHYSAGVCRGARAELLDDFGKLLSLSQVELDNGSIIRLR